METKKFAAFGSGLPLWNECFETEKQWARDFLGHVNPYTGKAYTEEPAVASLEILNENGIICAWRWRPLPQGMAAAMIADLQTHWNTFLKLRYTTTDRLRQAWAAGEFTPTAELLQNAGFAGGQPGWGLQVVQPSTADVDVSADGGPGGRPCIVINATSASHTAGLRESEPDRPGHRERRPLPAHVSKPKPSAPTASCDSVSLSMAHPPGTAGAGRLGGRDDHVAGSYAYFRGHAMNPHGKLMVSPPARREPAFAGRLLAPQGRRDRSCRRAKSLETGRVSMPLSPERLPRTHRRRSPRISSTSFSTSTAGISRRCATFLTSELACKHPIKGTQVDQYSSYFSQARCDFIDAHGYWQHPLFRTNRGIRKDWSIANTPMVNQACEVVVDLAGLSRAGQAL